MTIGEPDSAIPRYDRDFLLSPAKRNQTVELWEVEKFGRDSFGNPDAVSLYGMRPAEWHARGVRILARTALEAVRDPLGARIGHDVARIGDSTAGFSLRCDRSIRRFLQCAVLDTPLPSWNRRAGLRIRAIDL